MKSGTNVFKKWNFFTETLIDQLFQKHQIAQDLEILLQDF